MFKNTALMTFSIFLAVILAQIDEAAKDPTTQRPVSVNPQTLPAEVRYFEIRSGSKLVGACGYSLAPYEGGKWKLDGWTIISVSIADSSTLIRLNESAILDGSMRLFSSRISLSTGQLIEISMEDSSNVIIQTTKTEATTGTGDKSEMREKSTPKEGTGPGMRREDFAGRPHPGRTSEEKDRRIPPPDSGPQSVRDRKPEPDKKTEVYTKNVQVSTSPYLLADYCFHHWAILVKAVRPRFEGIQKFYVLRPTISDVVELVAQVGHTEDVGGVVAYKIDFTGGNIQASLWADSTNGALVQMSIPAQNISLVNTKTMPDTSAFLSFVLAERVKPTVSAIKSDKNIEKPLDVKELNVELNVKLDGEFSGERAWQVFKGKFENNIVQGNITVTTRKYDGKGSAKIGDGVPEAVSKYVQSSEGIPADNSYIVAKAREFSGTTFWEVASSVSKWVATRVKNSPDKDNPIEALLYGRGNALARARLSVAIMRAKGIPSRIVGGLCYFAGYWIPHYWAEVWVGNKPGWRPIDPTTGESEQFSAVHITLWEGKGGVKEGTVKIVNVK